MRARRLCAALAAVLALLPLGGCKLYGNSRADTQCVAAFEAGAQLRFCLREGQTLVYDRKSAALSLDEESGDFLPFAGRVVLEGNTFPRRLFWVDEEYGQLKEQLFAQTRHPEQPLIQAYALEGEAGTVYGFCNEYSSATGYFAGGGQIDADKAYAACYFTYDAASDELYVHDVVHRGCIVAFSKTHFIYYDKKAYYAQDINGGSNAVKICSDDAYDKGFTNYSYADFYFSGDYCVMKFHRGYGNYKNDYDRFILCTMDGKTLGNIKINTWQENE